MVPQRAAEGRCLWVQVEQRGGVLERRVNSGRGLMSVLCRTRWLRSGKAPAAPTGPGAAAPAHSADRPLLCGGILGASREAGWAAGEPPVVSAL